MTRRTLYYLIATVLTAVAVAAEYLNPWLGFVPAVLATWVLIVTPSKPKRGAR